MISSEWIKAFQTMYQRLDASNLELLHDWYHQDVTFIDPIHEIKGLDALKSYFKGMYSNVEQIEFIYQWQVAQGNHLAIGWQMRFSHTKLNAGKTIKVDGVTHLEVKEDKILMHRDYFDLGAMLYEQIPLLGRVVRAVKSRAAN